MKIIFNHPLNKFILKGVYTKISYFDIEKGTEINISLWEPNGKPFAWEYIRRNSDAIHEVNLHLDQLWLALGIFENFNTLSQKMKFNVAIAGSYLLKNWLSSLILTWQASILLAMEAEELNPERNILTDLRPENPLPGFKNPEVNKCIDSLKDLLKMDFGYEAQTLETAYNMIVETRTIHHPFIDNLAFLELDATYKPIKQNLDFEIDLGVYIAKFTRELKSITEKMEKGVIEVLNALNKIVETRFEELKK